MESFNPLEYRAWLIGIVVASMAGHNPDADPVELTGLAFDLADIVTERLEDEEKKSD